MAEHPPDADSPAASPFVTVLIAAYNAADFISRAIASALAQDGVRIELLVVDDASTDATRAVVEALARDDARVRLLALPRNGGPSVARNAGLDAARGDWIAVLDADDAFLPGRLAHLAAIAGDAQADIVADNFRYYEVAEDEIGDPALVERDATEVIDIRRYVAGARPYAAEADLGLLKPMFSGAFMARHGLRYPADIRHGEDFLLMFDALRHGARLVLTRRPGYLYTTRASGRSRTRIDYPALAATARTLAAAPDVAADPALVRLFHERSDALERLAVEREVDAAWERRDVATLARTALAGRQGSLEIARRARRWMQR